MVTPVSSSIRRRTTRAVPDATDVSGISIGQYLIRRLYDYGVRDAFGLPGDYVLTFYDQLTQSPIRVVNCTREDCAGFAADAYARIHGMGAVCVTYCVGGLSLCNSIAGAYAEKSPVVVISGSPGLGERINNPLLHHRVRDFRTQLEVFDKLCVATADLSDARTAFHEIDRVLDACMRYKRPVYFELPRDMVNVAPTAPHQFKLVEAVSDADALAESVKEAVEWIESAKRPCMIAGVEIHRFNLQDDVLAFAEGSQIGIAADILGKSVISEVHPLYVGLYEGALGRDEVTRFVEESDCIVLLGTFMTDINLGIFTANLDPRNCIYATSEQLRIRHHHFHNVLLDDFIRGLVKAKPKAAQRTLPPRPQQALEPYVLKPNDTITIMRLMARLNESLDNETVVIADVGDAMFSATELVVRERTEFIAPAYYTSMGFAVPAALGANVARDDLRVVAVVGDGAFQMTGMELSTIVVNNFAPIVIVLDNKGYGTERFLHPGDFNDINPWKYHRLPEILNGGKGYEVRTEGEFDAALRAAWNDRSGVSLIQVHIGLKDRSTALDRLAERLSKRVQMSNSASDDWRPAANWDRLRLRDALLRKVRGFFHERGFIEVETPILSHDVVVDRHLDPFQTTLARDPRRPNEGDTLWLQTSPEFGMKRLLAAGGEAIFQVTRAFRNGERGRLHSPEFTIVEWYRRGDGYQEGMRLLSDLGETLLGRGPAERITYADAFQRHVGVNPHAAPIDELSAAAETRQLSSPSGLADDRDGWLNLLLAERVEQHLGRGKATILYDYPASQAALACVRNDRWPVAERYELYVEGIELANGYHELLDAGVLRERNRRANQLRAADGKPALPEESRLLDAMEAGLPQCCGCALGFDRVAMLAAGAQSIDEVIAFPIARA